MRKQGAALLVGIVALVLWEVLIEIFHIEQFLLPKPSVIGDALLNAYPRLLSAGWVTFQNAFWGFMIGCGAGILTGVVSSRFVSFSKALLPVAIAVNAIPILALAPIFNNWFGALNPASKIAIVAVSGYFPSMISTVRGLTSVGRAVAGVDEILRGEPGRNLSQAARALGAAVHLLGAQGRHDAGDDRRDCQRILRRLDGGLGYRIRDDAGLFKYPGSVVGDLRRCAVRHYLLHGGFCRGTGVDVVVAHLVPREMRERTVMSAE